MIDTLHASKTLQKNGFSLQQSDILAKVIAQQSEELATKQDIQLLKKDTEALQLAMRQDIQLLRKDMKQDIQLLRKDTETLQLAAKQDIQLLRKDMKQDIQLLKKDMETLREDITKSIRHIFWLLALIFPVIITILILFAQR